VAHRGAQAAAAAGGPRLVGRRRIQQVDEMANQPDEPTKAQRPPCGISAYLHMSIDFFSFSSLFVI
jgi:hypothetical protein